MCTAENVKWEKCEKKDGLDAHGGEYVRFFSVKCQFGISNTLDLSSQQVTTFLKNLIRYVYDELQGLYCFFVQ